MIFQNPVVLKEMRARMRGARAFIIVTFYLILLGGLVGSVYIGFTLAEEVSYTSSSVQTLGKSVFGAVVGIEMMMVCFLAPSLTSGAIASERERQTYDLLRTTLLSSHELVSGKLVSALSFLLLLLAIAFPLQGLAFLFGGVAIEEVLIALLMLVVTAVFFSVFGLFVSSFIRSTLGSTVVSNILAILGVFGTPLLLAIALTFFGFVTSSSLNLTANQQLIFEIIIVIIGYMLIALNPIAAAVVSAVLIIEEQATFLYQLPLTNGRTFPIISPWITYSIFFLVASLVLIWLTVRLVRRVDK